MAASGSAGHLANRMRNAKQDAMREYLQARGFEQQVSDDIEKLRDLETPLTAEQVNRIKAANDLRMRLLAKVLPDLKAIELSGDVGATVAHTFVNPAALSTNTLRELLAQREAASEQPAHSG